MWSLTFWCRVAFTLKFARSIKSYKPLLPAANATSYNRFRRKQPLTFTSLLHYKVLSVLMRPLGLPLDQVVLYGNIKAWYGSRANSLAFSVRGICYCNCHLIRYVNRLQIHKLLTILQSKGIISRDTAILPRKLDWMVTDRAEDLKTIMSDNATFIQFPPIGSSTSLITVFGDHRVNIQRTIRSVMQLVRWLLRYTVTAFDALRRLASSMSLRFGYFRRSSMFFFLRPLSALLKSLQSSSRSPTRQAPKLYSRACVSRCMVSNMKFATPLR